MVAKRDALETVLGAGIVGMLIGIGLMGLAVWGYVSVNCADVSAYADLINAFGGHVPHHLVVCAAP